MISIVTFSMEGQVDIKGILETHNIDYTLKVVNRSGHNRDRHGRLGEDIKASYEYIFYVKKSEYELAKSYIGCI